MTTADALTLFAFGGGMFLTIVGSAGIGTAKTMAESRRAGVTFAIGAVIASSSVLAPAILALGGWPSP